MRSQRAGRQRTIGTGSRLAVAALAVLFLFAIPGHALEAQEAVADAIPRHAIETRALQEPDQVLAELPALIVEAEQRHDAAEVALLFLAKANACRIVADWNCQRDAGERARLSAQLAQKPLLVIRGLIAESRGAISLQDFSHGERLLGEAELLLKTSPLADLSADVYLAYSSLSYALGKHALAAEYADRGLAVLPDGQATAMQVRLLRNRARAQIELKQRPAAKASLDQAQQMSDALGDPKLSAELLVESAHLAHLDGDVEAQERNGKRVLELSDKLKNSQLKGLGHEIMGMLAIDQGLSEQAASELRAATASFHVMGQQRDELRVLRELIRIEMQQQHPHAPVDDLVGRFLDLGTQIERDERAKASADFDARLKYAEGEIELVRLKDEAVLAQERERSLAHRDQLTRLLIALALAVVAVLMVFFVQQRRSYRRLQQALRRARDSESLYRTLADHSSDLVVRMRMDGRRLYVSPSAREMLGYDPVELLEPRWELLHPDDRERVVAALKQLSSSETPMLIAYRVMSKRGHYVWVEALARLVPSAERPGEKEIIYSGRDISARVEVEQALEASQKRLSAITDNIPALIAYHDREARYVFANAAFEQILGVNRKDLIGKHIREVHGEQTWREIADHVAAALRGERVSFNGEARVRNAHYYYQANYVPDLDDNGQVQGFFALTFDITPLKRAERELEQLTRQDSLTGLANRRDFDQRLDNAIARSRRRSTALALLCVDIDHFKRINDTFGHPVGDHVIREIARRLCASVREGDMVARIGGDEFVVLIEDAESPAAMEVIARKLVEAVRAPISTDAAVLVATISIGVGFSRSIANADALMSLADQALYAAKAAGRNTTRTLSDDA
ncbi:MAG: diguanylate cyclase [Tahibacter sp.]